MSASDDTRGPVILWRDYGHEGWKPTSYPDVRAALLGERYESSFIITRVVKFDVVERSDVKPAP